MWLNCWLLTSTAYARRRQEGTWLALVTFYVQREVGRIREPGSEPTREPGLGTSRGPAGTLLVGADSFFQSPKCYIFVSV